MSDELQATADELRLQTLDDVDMPSREDLDRGTKHVTRLRSRFLVATGKGPIGSVLMHVLDEDPEMDHSKIKADSFVEDGFRSRDLGHRLVNEWAKHSRPAGWLADEPPGVYEVEMVWRVTEAHWAGPSWCEGDVEVLEVDYEPRWRWGG